MTSHEGEEAEAVNATIASDRGLARSDNEDGAGAFGWIAPRDGRRPVRLTARTCEPLIAVVADGLGGHRGGGTASSLAVDRLLAAERTLNTPAAIDSVLRTTHTELLMLGESSPELRHLATTIVVAVVLADRVIVAHVGDSRVYYVEDGLVQQLTEDDSAPGGGTLTQVLGGLPGTDIEPHIQELPRDLRARYLMCSDGLHGYVPRDAMRDAAAVPDPLDAATALIDAAYNAGAPDNVSVCLLDVAASPPGEGGDDDRAAE
jgi:PPM family protein phosphatase